MANEQTSVPLFVADTILTAAQQNISAGTGVPVFATTVTRDAAFGGANKALAEGQLCYLSATNVVQYYDGAAWATVGPATAGGFTLISATTATAVASVSINNCFSSTFGAYEIIIINTASVGADSEFSCRLRASGTDTTTNYKQQRIRGNGSTVSTSANPAGTDEFALNQLDATNKGYYTKLTLLNPNIADKTTMQSHGGDLQSDNAPLFDICYGVQTASTQFDGITFITSGTSFTGTIRVYGYANSQETMSTKLEVNAQTGETIIRDYTDDENAQRLKDQAKFVALANAKVAKALAKQAVSDKLGLTADETAALLGQFGANCDVDWL